MSIHLINTHPSLSIIRKRQLLPYVHGRPIPSTYKEAIHSTVDSFAEAKRTLDWFFDVAGFQSSATDDEGIPSLSERQKMYLFEDSDKFPPHLQSIPSADRTPELHIFKFTRLYDTIILMFHAYWLDFNGVHNLGPAGATTMKDLEARNAELHSDANSGFHFTDNMFTLPNVGLRPDWYTDAVFAQQSFTGTNPTAISRASEQWIQTFTQAAQGNKDVLNLLKTSPAASFYVQDYSYFRQAIGLNTTDTITSTPSDDGVPQFGCASVALFYLPPSGKLHPLAIILDWKGSLAASVTIFNKRVLPTYPTDGEAQDWPWRYAKMCVQVSDWTRHELTVHLNNTHFIEEALLVAAQRSFPTDHPVYQLLKEHWTTTLSINALARSVLIPKVIVPISPFTEDQIYKFVDYEYTNFDFTGLYVPNDLESRGFPVAELETNPKYHNYGYGRDIQLVWKTLRKYVSTILTQSYKGGDAQVENDAWVAAYCKEMQSPTAGRMSKFPTVTTLDGLIDMVTMCIHIASPQHTAVNYLQQYYMTFVPNKPASLYQPLPASLAALQRISEADVVNSLPILSGQDQDWLLMAQVPFLLSPAVEEAVSLTTFAKQEAADRNPVVAAAARALQTDLLALTKALRNVSAQLDDQTKEYDVLYPDETAKAIVI